MTGLRHILGIISGLKIPVLFAHRCLNRRCPGHALRSDMMRRGKNP